MTEPSATWLTDITEDPTAESKVFCCAIKDLSSNRIVGYAIGDRMTADRGSQFRARSLRAVLDRQT